MKVRILLVALVCVLTGQAQAQSNYPSRPVRIVVPSPPAGGTDIIARVLAQYFSNAMGQQFYVENRPGAGNMIGIESVARAAPDGYTLLFVPSTLALNSVMYKKVSYDPVRDFAPITLAAAAPNVLVVNPKVPARSHRRIDRAREAKARAAHLWHTGHRHLAAHGHGAVQEPGRRRSAAHSLSRHGAGDDRRHQRTDHGHVLERAHRQAADRIRRRAGAWAFRAERAASPCRTCPRSRRRGCPNYEATQWYGLVAPAGTPPDIIARLHAEATQALKTQDMKDKLASDGAEPVGTTPAEFAAHIKSELEKWANVARVAKIEPQ